MLRFRAVFNIIICVSFIFTAGLSVGYADGVEEEISFEEVTENPVFDQEKGHPGYKDGKGIFVIAPLIGSNENTLKIPARGPMPAMEITDSEEELGLFALYATPRMVISNMFFYSDPHDTDVWGDVFFLNFYGPAEETFTWNAGLGYVWHKIDTDNNEITVNVPMAKFGAMIRCPENFSFNPYLAYAAELVDTDYGDEDSDTILYGLTAKWRYRMLHTTVKFYLQDNLDTHKSYNVARARVFFAFNRHWGLALRAEYMEESVSKNTSFLIGPAFSF